MPLKCECGAAKAGGFHSPWCPVKSGVYRTEPAGNHEWGTFRMYRGKFGSWVCEKCGYEAYRAGNVGHATLDPVPKCAGKKR